MRRSVSAQYGFVQSVISHRHGQELEKMSCVLDAMPEISKQVVLDIVGPGRSESLGREGMSGEQVLRALILKQQKSWSYAQLHFELSSSFVYQRFARITMADKIPTCTTLKRNIKRVKPSTLQWMNELMLEYAKDKKIEAGRRVRIDCTAVESNIHAPSDSSLLWDGVRVLTRLMQASAEFVDVPFCSHKRRAKRRMVAIQHARSAHQRKELYKDLLKVSRKTAYSACCVQQALQGYVDESCVLKTLQAQRVKEQLHHYGLLLGRVIAQTQARVLHDKSVPALDKVVSLFEEHTDVIVKNRRETVFGHKIALSQGRSGLFLDLQILQGNPNDATLAQAMVQHVQAQYPDTLKQVCFDGGFASKENLKAIKDMNLTDVVFHKKCGLHIDDMASSNRVFRSLKNFRAGVESGISFLKRCFGLTRCTYKGEQSFKSYAWASVISHNLLLIARHMLL